MSAAVALNHCFADEFPTISSARKAIQRSEVLSHSMEELSSNSLLRSGDVVLVHLQACPSPGLFARPIPDFTVLFEADHLAAVVKPPGVLTHPTVLSALAYALQPTRLMRDAMDRPQPLHRLDKGTGGILLAGRTLPAAQELYRQFAKREVAKEYAALVCGLLTGRVSAGEPGVWGCFCPRRSRVRGCAHSRVCVCVCVCVCV